MATIRKAEQKDQKSLLELLKSEDLDFWYPGMPIDSFYLAEDKKKIVGIVQLREFENFFFLDALGVIKEFRKKGIGKLLLEAMLKKTYKDLYIYTIIPNFFKKFGFKTVATPDFLPPRAIMQCEDCYPEKCKTMVLLR